MYVSCATIYVYSVKKTPESLCLLLYKNRIQIKFSYLILSYLQSSLNTLFLYDVHLIVCRCKVDWHDACSTKHFRLSTYIKKIYLTMCCCNRKHKDNTWFIFVIVLWKAWWYVVKCKIPCKMTMQMWRRMCQDYMTTIVVVNVHKTNSPLT